MTWELIVAAIGVIVWGIRLEGKVNVQDQRQTDLEKLLDSRLSDIKERLVRIERHVLNGSAHD